MRPNVTETKKNLSLAMWLVWVTKKLLEKDYKF